MRSGYAQQEKNTALTEKQIVIIKASWSSVLPVSDEAAVLFYRRLFELEPSYREMFTEEIMEQGRRLIESINAVVEKLDDLEQLEVELKQLGRRHAGYGVSERDFPVFGSTMLWTLEQILGDDFSRDVKMAWSSANDLIARIMISGMIER